MMVKAVWPAAMLVLVALLAGADEHTVLRLERRFTNASTEQLVKMDQMRHARQGLYGGVVQLPVIGKGYSYPDMIGGCGTLRSGELAADSFDGIFGFSPYLLSFSSQLHSLGLSSGVFSVCMKSGGGGILVFGEILEPGIVYTPLLPSLNYYELNLESISVNGQELPIDPSVFKPSRGHITVVDSGTTFAYIADGAFDPIVDAIAAAVSPSVRSMVRNEDICFVTSRSVDSSFPTLTLHFVGGAAMILKPKNYLRSEDQTIYCVAWKRNYGKQITVLGDIVLMDKIVVHDLENMLFGWTEYDCSRSVNVASSTRKKHVNSGHVSHRISINTGVAIMLAHVLIVYAISVAS